MKRSVFSTIISLSYAFFVLIFSLHFYTIYVGQDLYIYNNFYSNIPNDFLEAYKFYNNSLGSKEPLYFLFVYTFSSIIDKAILFSICNAFLAYLLCNLFVSKFRLGFFPTLFLLSNYYLWVVYFPAERLKFAILAFILLVLFNKRYVLFKSGLTIISHIQGFLLLYQFYLVKYYKDIIKVLAFSSFKSYIRFFFVVSVFLGLLFLMREHLITKVEAYANKETGFDGVLKVLVLMIISLVSSYKKTDVTYVILSFLPLLLLSLFLGGDRIVMFAVIQYFYIALYRNRNGDYIFYIVSFYFLYKTYDFFSRAYIYGYSF